ncbi:MAG: hypothetical protein KatS3mg060_3215 [Dehalococcoidia bacterium]|nr:MAG: hypothetical protein KatS3mg060_3215 [Dehalococcoidia bacterium]
MVQARSTARLLPAATSFSTSFAMVCARSHFGDHVAGKGVRAEGHPYPSALIAIQRVEGVAAPSDRHRAMDDSGSARCEEVEVAATPIGDVRIRRRRETMGKRGAWTEHAERVQPLDRCLPSGVKDLVELINALAGVDLEQHAHRVGRVFGLLQQVGSAIIENAWIQHPANKTVSSSAVGQPRNPLARGLEVSHAAVRPPFFHEPTVKFGQVVGRPVAGAEVQSQWHLLASLQERVRQHRRRPCLKDGCCTTLRQFDEGGERCHLAILGGGGGRRLGVGQCFGSLLRRRRAGPDEK